MTLIGLLLTIIVACIVLWATQALLNAFSVTDPLRTVVFVIVVVIVLIMLFTELLPQGFRLGG